MESKTKAYIIWITWTIIAIILLGKFTFAGLTFVVGSLWGVSLREFK